MRNPILSTLAVVVALISLVGVVFLFRWQSAALTPTGRFGVGTRTVVWTHADSPREIPVSFAYPAIDVPAGVAIARAAPMPLPKHPLVVFAPDAGSSASFYRSLAHELAASGTVTALVGVPGIERITRYPDRVEQWDDVGRGAQAARDASGWPNAASDPRYASAATVAAGDIELTLDKINEEAHDRLDPLFVSIRVGDVAFAGHGVGGTAALLACKGDSRCDAAATIAGPPADATPFDKPLLAIATGDGARGLDGLFESATGPTYRAVLEGTARLDVADVSRVVPRLFLPSGSVADPSRGTRGARDVLLAFVLRHLVGYPVPLLDSPDVIPGVALSSRNQVSAPGSAEPREP
jgi:hypothetical protein